MSARKWQSVTRMGDVELARYIEAQRSAANQGASYVIEDHGEMGTGIQRNRASIRQATHHLRAALAEQERRHGFERSH